MFAVKVSMLVALVSLSYCEPPATSYGVPLNSFVNPSNPSSTFNHHDHHEGQDPDHLEPKSYEFGYAVKDDYTGNDYKRRETSDGNQVNGEYRVQLPDGRTQIVTYYADWQTGFHADVRYEGTASYPDQYANGQSNGNFNNQGLNNQYGAPGFGPNNGVNLPSNQYGAPFNNNNNNNNNQGGYNTNNQASSSVTIKDFSGPGTPYNTNSGYNNGYGNGNQFGNNDYDSYASGNFGSRRPAAAYGAP